MRRTECDLNETMMGHDPVWSFAFPGININIVGVRRVGCQSTTRLSAPLPRTPLNFAPAHGCAMYSAVLYVWAWVYDAWVAGRSVIPYQRAYDGHFGVSDVTLSGESTTLHPITPTPTPLEKLIA